MTLQLLVNGVDFTSAWRPYESRWNTRAWQGESVQSEFIIDDPTGAFVHDNFRARKIVEVWEDASGSPKCMYRGRIANKYLGPGMFWAPGHAMRWTLLTDDFNVDLRGIRVINATRPEETNYARAEVIRQAYLNGAASTHPSARDSTDLDGLYIGPTPGDAFTLPAETYTDLDPAGVLGQMTEMDGHIFFVYLQDDGVGALVYMGITDEEILSDISIVDDAHDEGADGVDVFAAYHLDTAGDHGGQNVLSGAAIRYNDGSYFEESDVGGREAIYDKWEVTISNDLVTSENSADLYVNTVISANEEVNTYFATIDIRAEDVHRIKAGMMVELIRKRANKLGNATARAVNVTYEPATMEDGHQPIYRVSLELGRPRFLRTIPPNRRRVPRPPTQPTDPTPGTCTRYYFSADSTGTPTVTRDASWDKGNGDNGMALEKGTLVPTQESVATNSWGVGTTAVPLNFEHGQFFLELPSAGTVSGFVKSMVSAKRRTGVGVTSAQRHQAQMVVRVVSSDGSTVRGTALAAHEPGVLDSAFLQSTHQSIKFPASSQWGDEGAPLTPVAHSAGDWLVVEMGVHTVVDGSGTGASIDFEGTSGQPDFDAEFIPRADGHAWIDICTAGTAGTPGDDPEDIGTTPDPGDDTDTFAPIDHVHGHGDVDYDGSIDHDARSIEYNNETSGLTASTVQGAIDEAVLTVEEDGGSGPITPVNYILFDGATVTDDGDGQATVTVTGGAGGGHDITEDGGSAFTTRAKLDFRHGLDVTDDSGSNSTRVAVDESELTHNSIGGLTTGDPHTQYPLKSILTTRGDIVYRDATTWARRAIGTDGYRLVSDGTDPQWEADRSTLNFVIDGAGAAITTGIKGDVVIDFAATIESVTLLADQSGSIVVDIWKDTYANFPPVVGDSITASAKPTISSATKSQDATLTGWTTTIAAGDTLRFNVDSVTTVTRVTLSLKLRRT